MKITPCLTCRIRKKGCPKDHNGKWPCSQCRRLKLNCHGGRNPLPSWFSDASLFRFCTTVLSSQVAMHRWARLPRPQGQLDHSTRKLVDVFIGELAAGTARVIPSYTPSFDPIAFLDQWAEICGLELLGCIGRRAMPTLDLYSGGSTRTGAQSRGRDMSSNLLSQLPAIPVPQPSRRVMVDNSPLPSVIAPRSNEAYRQQPTTAAYYPFQNLDQINHWGTSHAPTLSDAPSFNVNHSHPPDGSWGVPQLIAPTPVPFRSPAASPMDQTFTNMTRLLLSQGSNIRRVVFVTDDCDVRGLGDRFDKVPTPFGVGVALPARGRVDDWRSSGAIDSYGHYTNVAQSNLASF